MVVNDPLKSFDGFLDSVTRMHDAINKFSINIDEVIVPNQPSFDNDLAALKELDDFTISEDSDLTNDSGSGDDMSLSSDIEESTGSLEALNWLESKCFLTSHESMSAEDLYSAILGVLTSNSPDDELQISLPEIIGYEHLDFVIELISKRSSIIAAQVSTSMF